MSARQPRHPVVLLHGWPVTDFHWRHLLPMLEQAGFEPVAITLPGLGTAPGDGQSFRKTDLAEWVGDALSRRGITRFAVVGHDWGATVGVILASKRPRDVTAVVVEEEVLPGIDIEIPAPGNDHYPTWHGPFNRAPGLAEQLVPGRETAYYGAFLEQSAGPPGLEPAVMRAYVDAYAAPHMLGAGLGYYRTRADDLVDVGALVRNPISAPVLAIGGRFAMGSAVTDGMLRVAHDVTGLVVDDAGHYPVEQSSAVAGDAIVQFLLHHHD